MNIVLCYPVSDSDLEYIKNHVQPHTVINAGQEKIDKAIFDADIFCGHAKVPVDWEKVVAQGRLKWIQSSAAGMDHCLVPSVIDSDIPVTSASGLFANQVAEQTMALTYSLFRKMRTFFEAQNKREFIRRPTEDLHGQTIGIVGLGGNGRRIAEFFAPLQTQIVATDLFPTDKPDCVDELWGASELPRLLEVSDVVVLAIPLNKHTHHLFGKAQFAQMKPGAKLINVARGAVVNESALIETLQNEHLSGAGLDVTEIEPLPADSPLWGMPNVVITPHVGAQSAHRVPVTCRFFCENFRRFQKSEELLNLVDKKLGFPKPENRINGRF